MPSPTDDAISLITRSNSILLLTHEPPDGDGLSTILALKSVLLKLGKKAVVAAGTVPALYHFLPGTDTVRANLNDDSALTLRLPLEGRHVQVSSYREGDDLFVTFTADQGRVHQESLVPYFGKLTFDLIIIADAPETHRLGRIFDANPNLFYETPTINIDHHISNTGFGTINLVDVTAASSTEIASRLITALEAKTKKALYDPDIATLLLTGIITDTGSFQHSNTTPRSLDVAADLIEKGARQQEVIQYLYKTRPLSQLKLWGRVLEKIQYEEAHRLVWSDITGEDLKATGATDEEAGGIVDELMTSAPGAEVVVLLKQNGIGTRISVRTTTPAVSAQEIAALFGGGGHTQAAGFLVEGQTVEQCREEVLARIREYQQTRLLAN